jgi:hypothetical protein
MLVVGLAVGLVWMACLAMPARAQVLDAMEDPGLWKVVESDGVRLRVTSEEGARGKCLRLDYDFVTGAGFCLIQREWKAELPRDYQFGVMVRGEGKPNNLEFKLLDGAGDSVWWINRRAFEWPTDWTNLANRKRRFEFAWGPSGGAELKEVSKIEIAIASSGGGKGTVWLDELEFTPIASGMPVTITASTQESEQFGMTLAMDGDDSTVWRSIATDGEETLTIDRGEVQPIGGLVVRWEDGRAPGTLRVDTSSDGAGWTQVRGASAAGEMQDFVPLRGVSTRLIRLSMTPIHKGSAIGVREVEIRDEDLWETPNEVIRALAKSAPEGTYPKQFLDRQSYWTVVGAPGSKHEALINEEGSIEVSKRGFTLEPFIRVNGDLRTWADGEHTQSLQGGYLPIPTVERKHQDSTLTVTTFASGGADESALFAKYRLRNTSNAPLKGEFVLSVRPFQVNPPWQRLNFEGGVSPIRELAVERLDHPLGPWALVSVNGASLVQGWEAADRGGAAAFSSTQGAIPTGDSLSPSIVDPEGLATGVLEYAFELAPGAERVWYFDIHMDGAKRVEIDAANRPAAFDSALDKTVQHWEGVLNRVKLTLPREDRWIYDTFRSQLACVMINRDGPAIQPGSRSYERSWARDGSMTSAALLECEFIDEVREWIEWFASHQFESGKVPCVVDDRGPDPVPEHDSHGEFIWAVANYAKYTGDTEFLTRMYPRVKAAVGYIEGLRAQRMTAEFEVEGTEAQRFYGLVPESISHEGYSAKPMHSYWDNFFCLLGLKEAVWVAQTLGAAEDAEQWESAVHQYRSALKVSIERTMMAKGVDYIPGCAELGDFDSTSTTIAMFPCDEQGAIPPAWLEGTFSRYKQFFRARASPGAVWDAYTPYEIRHVGAFVRLGEPEFAHETLRWFRGHQRPAGWNHWAEVVWNDRDNPRFLGDMPHTWVGSDYLNAVRSMFVYEREGGLVVFGGVPRRWVESGELVSFMGFRTPWGELNGSLKREGNRVKVSLKGGPTVPQAGITVVCPPGVQGEDVVIRELPADVSWEVTR